MPFVFKRLALLMSIAAAFAADKRTPFQPPSAESMAHRQTNEQVTIGADPFSTAGKARTAFGKLDPNQYGVLPVLVVIQNDSKQTLDAGRLEVRYKGPGQAAVDYTPAADVKFLRGVRPPGYIGTPTGGTAVMRGKKNPLDVWEIEGHAFSAKMIPPGRAASGFFYFQADLKPGATIYLSGLAGAGGGKELFYFEIPLE
jgi:hypothetical protein